MRRRWIRCSAHSRSRPSRRFRRRASGWTRRASWRLPHLSAVDSDIPMAVRMREPFAMTFPIETAEDAGAQARVIEATPAAATSDRGRGALCRRAACRQAGRASYRRRDRDSEKPIARVGTRLCTGLAGTGRIALADGQDGCASPRRTCALRERAHCWRLENNIADGAVRGGLSPNRQLFCVAREQKQRRKHCGI